MKSAVAGEFEENGDFRRSRLIRAIQARDRVYDGGTVFQFAASDRFKVDSLLKGKQVLDEG